MKILQANIFGFGKWKQTTIDLSEASFIIIAGENESGKSTLRQFMLFILFGMPPKQRNQYLPKTGGEMGGTLTIQTDDVGTFTIERIHDRKKAQATCYHQDGTVYEEWWLRERLNGVDAQTFADIFSFDSISLQRLQQIKQEDIGEVLLGVGMTGTDQIYWTEKWLDQQLQQLFKPQGKKPVLNQLIESMEEKTIQLEKMEQEAQTYQEKQQMESNLEEAVVNLQVESESLRRERQQLEQKQQLHGVIESFYHAQQQLKQFPLEMVFPTSGLARYQQVKEQILPLKSELTVIEMNIEKEAQQMEELAVSMLPIDAFKKLEQVTQQRHAYYETKNKHGFIVQTKQDLITQLKHDIDQLQIKLSLDQLFELALPFSTEDIWQQLKEEKEQMTSELAAVEYERNEIEEQQQFLEQEIEEHEQKQFDQTTINQLKQQVEEKKQLDRNQRLASMDQQQKKSWQKLKEKRVIGANRFSIISVIIIVITSSIGFLFSNAYLYSVSVLFFISSLLHQLATRQSIRSMEPFISTQYHSDSSYPNAGNVQDISKAEDLLAEQAELSQLLEKMADRQRILQLEQLKANERKQYFKQKQLILSTKKSEQIEQFPFLEAVSISHWPKLFHHIIKAIEKVEKLDKLNQEIKVESNHINQYESLLREAFHSYLTVSTDNPEEMLPLLLDEFENQKNVQEKRKQLEDNHIDLITQRETVESKMIPYEQEIEQLWNKALVNDEESYIVKGNQKKEQEELLKESTSYERQLRAFLSDQEWNRVSQGEQIEKAELDNAFDDMSKKLKETQSKIDLRQQQLADVHSEIRQMEMSTSYQDEKHRYHQLKSDLQEQAKQWAIYNLAKEKLQETKQVYQSSFLPKVLKRTSELFNYLTNQKYHNVFLTELEAMLQVEDVNGLRFTVAELSQGSRDQLYISLRIALSEIIQKKQKMPFFIDDAFVHFDPIRLDKMLTIFQQVSSIQQIILFTSDLTWSEEIIDKSKVKVIKI